jgi:Undecaprenyl-phosphate galactose phosphotransferase WbaP
MGTNLEMPSNFPIATRIAGFRLAQLHNLSRVLDLTLILLAVPYIILAFGLIGILILLDSGGPVLFSQIRIGRNGTKFKLYKFRTMAQNADQLLQTYLEKSPALKSEWLATHKLQNDPRITRLGALLRKTSLDELPQLWNILIGDMSIVGPRPIVDAEVEKYGTCFDLYKQVRPGLTGLWQVSGRSNTSYQRRVELDEYYIRNRSLKLDLEILWKTVFVVLRKTGAY